MSLVLENSTNIPEWVIRWYIDNNISCNVNKSNMEEKETEDNRKQDNKNDKKNKRIAPYAWKICDICKEKMQVSSAKKFCIFDTCNGEIKLLKVPRKTLKRNPPTCRKKCNTCNMILENIATALQKCKKCDGKLCILK